MSRIILIRSDCEVVGYTTSQERAYNYIMNKIEDVAKYSESFRKSRKSECIKELQKTYELYCNGQYEYFGTGYLDVIAENTEEIEE